MAFLRAVKLVLAAMILLPLTLALLLAAFLAVWVGGQSLKHAYFLSESPILKDLDEAPLARAEVNCSGNTNRNQSLALTKRLQDRFATNRSDADLVALLREQKFDGPTLREGAQIMARSIMIGELSIAKIHTYSVNWTTNEAGPLTQLWGCVTVFYTD